MAYRIDHKYTFYHIFKTGGTSVRAYMEKVSKDSAVEVGREGTITTTNVKKARAMQRKHCCPLDISDHCIDNSFTVVRHPAGLYESIYKSKSGKGGLFFANGWRKITTFDDFVSDTISQHPYGFVTAMYCRVIPYVKNILRLENIENDLPSLFESFGYKKRHNVGHENKSRGVSTDISKINMQNLLSVERGIIVKLGYL